jgi:hypothetical protein
MAHRPRRMVQYIHTFDKNKRADGVKRAKNKIDFLLIILITIRIHF